VNSIHEPRKSCYSQEKYSQFLHKAEISVILADFYLNLVVMATPFAPWEIQIAYLNSTIPKPYHIRKNCHHITCIFCFFLSKFGCHGNSLKILNSICEFTNPHKPRYSCKKILYFLHGTEISAILAYFCPNLVAMQLPWNFCYYIWICRPRKHYYSCKKFLDFMHRTKISAILAYFCPNLVVMATPLAPLTF